MTLIGRSPIHPVLFVVAKAALVPPHLFLALGALQASQGTLAWPAAAPLAAAAVVVGLGAVSAGISHLGESIRVGLPREETALRTAGLYRFSRNPIYAGLFLSMVGSCVLVPHIGNLASSAVAIVLHHRIVLAEERFLMERFGQSWVDYRSRVRRYLGPGPRIPG